jgi:esterase/lipase
VQISKCITLLSLLLLLGYNSSLLAATESTTWFKTTQSIKGVVVMIHGLNTRPMTMKPLASFLSNQGYDVLLVALKGHRGSIEEAGKVTKKEWIDYSYEQYLLARETSLGKNVPLIAVGFSIGGLIHQHLINFKNAKFKKQILFAPALKERWYVNILRGLLPLSNSTVIPSSNHPEYKANSGSTIAEYSALFGLLDEIDDNYKIDSNILSLIICDPSDNLVSCDGIKDIAKENKFHNWSFVDVDNKNALIDRTYHHLIIDERSLGRDMWRMVKEKIVFFLDKS